MDDSSRSRKRYLARPRLAKAVIVLGILATGTGAYLTQQEIESEARDSFRMLAADVVNDVEAHIRAYSDLLYSVRGLFHSSEKVTAEEFSQFVSGLSISDRYPGLTNISYTFRVPHARKKDFENTMRREFAASGGAAAAFSIKPPGERPEYHVLTYIEPLAPNLVAHGLDLGSDPVRLSAVEITRDSGKVSTSTALTLLRDQGTQQVAVLLRLAVYRTGLVPTTVEGRRNQYVGVAGVALRLGELMEGFAQADPQFNLVRLIIRDLDDDDSHGPILFDSQALQPAGESRAAFRDRYALTAGMTVGDRQWQVEVSPLADPVKWQSATLPYVALLAGLALTVLLYALLRSIRLSEHRADELDKGATIDRASSALSDALQACLNTEQAAQTIVKHAPVVLADTRGMLYLFEDSKQASAALCWDMPRHLTNVLQADDCLALHGNRIRFVQGTGHDIHCRHFEGGIPANYACVPLSVEEQPLGMLHLQPLAAGGTWTESERIRIVVASERIALALANLRLRESLREQATRDNLTGLYNRHYMEEWLGTELMRAKRTHRPLSVIMFDVDHFKRFNDRFGHDAGDLVLREVGHLLKTHARGTDIVCRFGGEEFIALLPECTAEQATQQAERLRRDVKQLALEHDGRPLGGLTVSAGIAAYPVHGPNSETVIKCADQALYRAKETGRDRVVAFEADAYRSTEVRSAA